jgi:hypothetical protein
MSNQPNHPPKSAEEVLTEFNLDDSIYRNVVIQAMQSYASQFARYVTDEEIDAMFPYPELPIWDNYASLIQIQREAAKAMRDMIFGHRSA